MKQFLAAALIFLSTSGYGFGPGLELGAGLTAATIDFRTSDLITGQGKSAFQFYPTQESLGANLFAKYGFCGCPFPLALQFDGFILGSNAEHKYSFFGRYFSQSRCRTIVDLSLKPGYMITNWAIVEAKGGISFGYFRHEIDQSDVDSTPLGRASDSRTRLGYVLGVAMRVEARPCLSAYAAFDWHAYSGDLAITSAQFQRGVSPPRTITSKLTLACARTFTLGLSLSI
jgi:hypothetical protein